MYRMLYMSIVKTIYTRYMSYYSTVGRIDPMYYSLHSQLISI